jgi:hypothetical protein
MILIGGYVTTLQIQRNNIILDSRIPRESPAKYTQSTGIVLVVNSGTPVQYNKYSTPVLSTTLAPNVKVVLVLEYSRVLE